MTVRAEDPINEGIQRLASVAEERLEHHLSPEELTAYHEGTLDPDRANQLQGHLTLCRECTALYLDLVELAAAAPDIESEPDSEPRKKNRHLTFEAIQRRLQQEESVSGPSDESHRRWPEFLLRPGFAYSLAASLALTTGLLGWQVLNLERSLQEQTAPRFNIAIHDLDPASSLRSEATAKTLTLPADDDRWVLILTPAQPPTDTRYRGRLLGPDGRVLWQADDLRPTEFGNFTLELARPFLPSGPYRIEIRRLDDPEAPLDSFVVQIE